MKERKDSVSAVIEEARENASAWQNISKQDAMFALILIELRKISLLLAEGKK